MQKKHLNKIKHPFMTKAVNNLGIEGSYFSIVKAIYKKKIVTIILNGRKTESFSSEMRNKARVPAFTMSLQHSVECSSQAGSQEKEETFKLEKK